MDRVLAWTVVLLAIATSCGGPPTPTPDLVATQIAVEMAAHATMTAGAPTATFTPVPSSTPEPTTTHIPTSTPIATVTRSPTMTSTPTATRTPTKTSTPTATRTPTYTPTPTASATPLPKGWKTYAHFSDEFSLAYPRTWTVSNEGSESVVLDAPNHAFFRLDIYTYLAECSIGQGEDSSAAQKCLAGLVADETASDEQFRLVSTALWEDGYYRAYVVESTIYSTEYDLPGYDIQVFAAIPGQPGYVLRALYFKAGARTLTRQERNQFRAVVNSIRVSE